MSKGDFQKLVIYLPNLAGGGAERLHVNLASEFLKAGFSVTFLLNEVSGPLLLQIPKGCEIVGLNSARVLTSVPRLITFLRDYKPDVLISNMEHTNIICLLAKMLAGSKVKIIATQHISVIKQSERKRWNFKIILLLYKMFLNLSDKIVCVSKGVADEISNLCELSPGKIVVIHNGIIDAKNLTTVYKKASHEAFYQNRPVAISVGRLVDQKDHSTLLKSIVGLDVNLLILGEGPLISDIQREIQYLDLSDRVFLLGFIEDPRPFMHAAHLLVVSSTFEGFGNVLVEAMGCGTNVVSTNCPYGPSEILLDGEFGMLVPVGNPKALKDAIARTLQAPIDSNLLQRRAAHFSIQNCAEKYIELIDTLTESKDKLKSLLASAARD